MQRNRFFVRIVLAFLNRLSDTERAQIHTALRPQPRGYELGTAMRGTPCLVTVTAPSQTVAHNRQVMQRGT